MATESSSLVRLERDTVHRICSGQVIVTLASAAKELVENSLDAGATRIEVELKNFGSESLEVSDNGCGVNPSDFAAIALKHYTSKLQNFDDLSKVETLGFRGEALSSLCALSDIVIKTRHSSEPMGTRLEYNHEGKIVKTMHCARELGTTVTVSKLFSSLPVRHREFMKNIKKEYSKLVYSLQAYCLVSVGISITVNNQSSDSGRRHMVLSNGRSHSLRENTACVLGAKQLASLVEFEQCSLSECQRIEANSKVAADQEISLKVSGYVSSCSHGDGRSSTDRQYFFINRRPMDFSKLSKSINEAYHVYNRHQFPVVIFEIRMESDAVDINVTPDKRKVYMQEEAVLLWIVRCSLRKMYDKISSMINPQPSSQSYQLPLSQKEEENTSRTFSLERFLRFNASKRVNTTEKKNEPKPKFARLEQYLDKTAASLRKTLPDQDQSYQHVLPSLKGKSCVIPFSKETLTARNSAEACKDNSRSRFAARIAPEANKAALEELQEEFKKEHFLKIEAIGQFNLGFIVAKLNSDLFIIDQHASDEKYNFERLQKETVLENQLLVIPKTLELTASQETILLDNLDLFKMNGFHFLFDENGISGQRVKLKSVPVSKNWTFGSEDVQELLFLLMESPESVVKRPSRIQAMFASRACRSSVMVGTALDKRKMKRILRHMADLDQPWNCPHGRPTMRHLLNLRQSSSVEV